MVILLLGNDYTETFGHAVEVRVLGVHGNADEVWLNIPTYLVKKIELKLGKDEHGIRHSLILHVLLCGKDDVSGVLGERTVLRSVDDHRITRHRQRGYIAKGVNNRCPYEGETGVNVVSVAWPEGKGSRTVHHYDPSGEVLERGDIVLVPDESDAIRRATVTQGNHPADPNSIKNPLKRILGVIRKRLERMIIGRSGS